MLKFANILTSAGIGKASPFVLSTDDLKQLAQKVLLEKNIQLNTDLNNVKMIITVIDNHIQLFFSIPIEDDDQLFKFFKITPLPHFNDNTTLLPQIDATYIAISKENSEYHTVDADEFNRCIDVPQDCKVSSPVIPLNEGAHCVIKTYTTARLNCPLQETASPKKPFIRNIGNHTVFSVPEPTSLFIKCTNPNMIKDYQDSNIVIKGMGDITFRSGCTITLPDGSKWDTPALQPLYQMKADAPLYSPYNTFPMATNVSIKYLRKEDFTNIPKIVYVNASTYQIETPEDMAKEAFTNHRTLVPYIMRAGATIIIAALLLLLAIYMYIQCRKSCTFCPCVKPFPEQDQEIASLKGQLAAIQHQLKANYKNFKGSTKSLANYFSKSTTDLSSASYVPAEERVEMLPQPPPPIIKVPAGYTLYSVDSKPPSYSVDGPPPPARRYSVDEPQIRVRPKSILKENKVEFDEGLEQF